MIFAGGLVLLLAIAALVIDLGFVFMLRRHEQNAADPGALAAARYIPEAVVDRTVGVPKMWTAACFYASQNGFTPTRADTGTDCVGGLPSDGSVLTVNYPPGRSGGEYAGSLGHVEVVVSKPHRSLFAGVIGLGTIPVSTGAVAAYDTGAGGTSSLVALNDTECSSARLHGGGSGGGVSIFPASGIPPDSGGFVQVNSICGQAQGMNDNCSDGSQGALTIDGGTFIQSNTIYIQGGCNQNGSSGTVMATIDERASYVGDPLALVRPPNPADLPTGVCPTGPSGTPTVPRTCRLNGTNTIDPGTYYGGWQISNTGASLTLNPGIYVLAGGGFTQTGGVTVASASGRVLIFSTDSPACPPGGSDNTQCQQVIDFRGSTALDLRGLDKNTPCPPYGSTGCPYGGLLFWQDAHASGAGTNRSNIELEGNGTLYLEGTIYAAGGEVIITGNGLGTGCTPDINGDTNCAAVQVIADKWDVGGAGVLAMPYDPSLFFQNRQKGLVR